MTDEKRLYGLPDAEVLYRDPAGVWESEIEPYYRGEEERNPGPWVVKEWTVKPPLACLPDAWWVVETIDEMVQDDGEFTENPWPGIHKDPEVIAAAEALLEVMASKVTWLQADEQVDESHVIAVDDGEPIFDGMPMHRPRDDGQ